MAIWKHLGNKGFPASSDGKGSAHNMGDLVFNSWVEKIPWRRVWLPTPVFLLGEFHGQRGLAGYNPWDGKESDTAEQLILPDDSVVKKTPASAEDTGSIPRLRRSPGEGNGNPIQYSCLENSMDRGGSWATLHGDNKELDMTYLLNASTHTLLTNSRKHMLKHFCQTPK